MYMDDAVIAGLLAVGGSIAFISGIAIFVWKTLKNSNRINTVSTNHYCVLVTPA